MATTLNQKRRLCKVITTQRIPELKNILGPINRCKLTDDEIGSMLRRGVKVFEYNPIDPSEYKELSASNGGKSPFGNAEPKTADPITVKSVISKAQVEEKNATPAADTTDTTTESAASENDEDLAETSAEDGSEESKTMGPEAGEEAKAEKVDALEEAKSESSKEGQHKNGNKNGKSGKKNN